MKVFSQWKLKIQNNTNNKTKTRKETAQIIQVGTDFIHVLVVVKGGTFSPNLRSMPVFRLLVEGLLKESEDSYVLDILRGAYLTL